jgi:hypothetical protein
MDAARWQPVSRRFLGHRAEPLLAERMWGCSVELPDEVRQRQPWWEEAGFDAAGRPIALRQLAHDEGVTSLETTTARTDVIEMRLAEGVVARTFLDADGLPQRTEYESQRRPPSQSTTTGPTAAWSPSTRAPTCGA